MKRKIAHNITFDNEESYVRKMIDIHAAMANIPDSDYLTEREKDLFVQYVLLNKEGYNLVDKESRVLITKNANFNPKTRGISIYKRNLIDKNWILQTKEGIALPPIFKYLFHESNPVEMDVNLTLLVNEVKVKEDVNS